MKKFILIIIFILQTSLSIFASVDFDTAKKECDKFILDKNRSYVKIEGVYQGRQIVRYINPKQLIRFEIEFNIIKFFFLSNNQSTESMGIGLNIIDKIFYNNSTGLLTIQTNYNGFNY